MKTATVLSTLIAASLPWSLVQASRSIHEQRAADPAGDVEIVNVSGSIELLGWDRNEVEVTGSAGENVERVDVAGADGHTTIHVVSRNLHSWGADAEARLIIHVPLRSAVSASLVSADFKMKDVQGGVKLQTVSGTVNGESGGDVHVSTVSGDVHLTAKNAKAIEIKTISGDIQVTGGGGEVDLTTVSGVQRVELGDVARARFKSISGDVTASLSLAHDAQLDAESVSGDVDFQFTSAPAADFDIQSFSGEINNCFGPKPAESRYGPGSRLQFTNGAGGGHVRVNSKAGEIKLCAKGTAVGASPTMARPAVRFAQASLVVPYVF